MITLRKVSISHLVLLITLVFFTHRANALFIKQSFEVVNVGTSFLELYLDPFDASLGTLASVLLDFSAPSRIWSDQFDCTTVDALCTATGFASLDLLTGDPFTTRRYTSDNIHTFLPEESKLFTVSMTPYWFYSASVDLSPFTVASPRVVAYDEWHCTRNCSSSESGSGTQTLRGSLTYVYVPVPATLALLALGLVCLGVSRRSSALSGVL